MPRGSRPKPRLFLRLAACLAVGILTTVGVSWAGTLLLSRHWNSLAWDKREADPPADIPADWPAHLRLPAATDVKGTLGAEELRWQLLFFVESRPGSGEVEVGPGPVFRERHPGAIASIRIIDLRVTNAGWPAQALRHEHWHETEQLIGGGSQGGRTPRTVGHPTSLRRLGLPIGDHRLGINPLWPGFALNTALYSILALVLWVTPGTIRRALRRRRARCPACGYDLRDLPTCPECGA